MTIVIKEIQVRTTVERHSSVNIQLDDDMIQRIKEDLYRKIKDDFRMDFKKRRQR